MPPQSELPSTTAKIPSSAVIHNEDSVDDGNLKKISHTRKEILYEGHFYDVTKFINRHPGGNIIKFYTEPGEDATLAIQQFHHRSMNRIKTILKSFPRREATPEES
jgi:cytochrome b involved in lipid metabolism